MEHFRFSPNCGIAVIFCFSAIPNGKPLRTFPGIALDHDCFRVDSTKGIVIELIR